MQSEKKTMNNPVLDEIANTISEKFDRMERARDQAYLLHRQAIKFSGLSIKAIHRNEEENARKLFQQARDNVLQAKEALKDFPELANSGFNIDAQKEVAEAAATIAIITGSPIPSPNELSVAYSAYVNGLGEAVGELRRFVLDTLRSGSDRDVEPFLIIMDDIYYMLASMDYPDAITSGLRRTADVSRSLIEKTRGDLTNHLQLKNLRQEMARLDEHLKLSS